MYANARASRGATSWRLATLLAVVALGACESAAGSPSPAVAPSVSFPGGPTDVRASPNVAAPPSATASPVPVVAPSMAPANPPVTPSFAQAGRWEYAGKMHWARHAPVAVVLGDGRVLVFGDEGGKYEPAPAYSRFVELWNPTSGKWRRTDSLPSPRGAAAMVTLQDGRALVIGGLNDRWESYSSTYLFDPRTEHWTKTGLLHTARANPAAAVLQDGRVLVVGGTYCSGYRSGAGTDAALAGYRLADSGPGADCRDLATAEIYDPATGSWSRAGATRYARWDTNLAALGDGRVLVTGGGDPAELYEPATGRFTTLDQPAFDAAALTTIGAPVPVSAVEPGRPYEVVALADGNAIALEVRSSYSSDDGYVMLRQPFGFDAPDARWRPLGEPYAELENEEGPVETTWGWDYPLQISVALTGGRVLAAGGWQYLGNGYSRGTRDAAILETEAGTWSTLPKMPGSRIDAAVVALDDGSALVIGGYDDPSDGYPVALADTFRFVPAR
jgi:hypothetical protein